MEYTRADQASLVMIGAVPTISIFSHAAGLDGTMLSRAGLLQAYLIILFSLILLPRIRIPRNAFGKTLLTTSLLLFFWAIFASYSAIANPVFSLSSLIWFVSPMLLAYSIANQVQKQHGFFQNYLRSVFYGGLGILLVPLIILQTPPEISPDQWTGSIPAFGNIRVFSHTSTLVCACGLCLLMFPIRKPEHTAVLIGSIGLIAVTLWAGSRSSLGALIIPLVSLSVWTGLRFSRQATIAAAIFSGVLISMLIPKPSAGSYMFGAVDRTLSKAINFSQKGNFGSGRGNLLSWSLENIQQHTWTGIGFNQVGPAGSDVVRTTHAHNFLIEMVLSFGVPAGFSIILVVTMLMAIGLLNSLKSRDPAIAAGLFLSISMLSYSMVCGTLHNPVTILGFGVGLASLLTKGAAPEDSSSRDGMVTPQNQQGCNAEN